MSDKLANDDDFASLLTNGIAEKLQRIQELERELNEAKTTIAIEEARRIALDKLWKEKLDESEAREAQLRAAVLSTFVAKHNLP